MKNRHSLSNCLYVLTPTHTAKQQEKIHANPIQLTPGRIQSFCSRYQKTSSPPVQPHLDCRTPLLPLPMNLTRQEQRHLHRQLAMRPKRINRLRNMSHPVPLLQNGPSREKYQHIPRRLLGLINRQHGTQTMFILRIHQQQGIQKVPMLHPTLQMLRFDLGILGPRLLVHIMHVRHRAVSFHIHVFGPQVRRHGVIHPVGVHTLERRLAEDMGRGDGAQVEERADPFIGGVIKSRPLRGRDAVADHPLENQQRLESGVKL